MSTFEEMAHPEIARRRLLHQHLLAPIAVRPQDVVDHLVAVQAQDYFGAKWALGLRMRSGTDDVIEEAFNAGLILRTHLLRPTWHFVLPKDIRWLLKLTAPRVQAINAFMYRKTRLDPETLTRSGRAIADALSGGQYRTREELRQIVAQAGIDTESPNRLICMLMHAELEGLICSGPRKGKQFTYARLDERAPSEKNVTREEALVALTGRYFQSRGPATIQDFAKWSGLTTTDARKGLNAHRDKLENETIDGNVYWFSSTPSAMQPETGRALHLLSIYDEYISSYKTHAIVSTPEVAARLKKMGNALTHIVVADGQIVGTWNRSFRTSDVLITLNLFESLTRKQTEAVRNAMTGYADYWKTALATS